MALHPVCTLTGIVGLHGEPQRDGGKHRVGTEPDLFGASTRTVVVIEDTAAHSEILHDPEDDQR
jgi:hypothetical protein